MQQAVVIAGGRGSRLTKAGIEVPKLLLKAGEKRILDHIIEELEKENFSNVLFVLGYGHQKIISELQNLETSLVVEYIVETQQLGTFGALVQSEEKLDDSFAVILGDLYIKNANIGGLFSRFNEENHMLGVLCKYSDHPEDSDLIEFDSFLDMTQIHKYPHKERLDIPPISMAGVYFLRKQLVLKYSQAGLKDVSKDLVPHLLNRRICRVFFHQGEIRDLGTPSRLSEFNQRAAVHPKDLSKEKYCLLDRDGVLNIDQGHKPLASKPILTQIARELISILSYGRTRYAVVTNQPSIARGIISMAGAFEKTRMILVNAGASLELENPERIIFICPHFPESGHSGEVANLKIICQCRKPLPGLLLSALNQNSMRGSLSLLIGDHERDIIAGLLVGAEVLHLHTSIVTNQCFGGFSVKCVDSDSVLSNLAEWMNRDN
jgi:histidinol-phosphate phosphatase family protein